MLGLDGLHLIYYVILIFVIIYVLFFITSVSGVFDVLKLKKGVKSKRDIKIRRHAIFIFILLLLIVLSPLKLKVQSDNSREAVRHSFDTKVYKSNSEYREGSDQRYTGDKIKEEQKLAKEQWDKIRNE